MAGVPNLADIGEQKIVALAELGYLYRGEAGVAGRAFFLKEIAAALPTVHLHIVEQSGSYWQEKLLFRDYLRAHRSEMLQYEQLKRNLAETFRDDRHSYTANKTDFVQKTLEKAQLWRSANMNRI